MKMYCNFLDEYGGLGERKREENGIKQEDKDSKSHGYAAWVSLENTNQGFDFEMNKEAGRQFCNVDFFNK